MMPIQIAAFFCPQINLSTFPINILDNPPKENMITTWLQFFHILSLALTRAQHVTMPHHGSRSKIVLSSQGQSITIRKALWITTINIIATINIISIITCSLVSPDSLVSIVSLASLSSLFTLGSLVSLVSIGSQVLSRFTEVTSSLGLLGSLVSRVEWDRTHVPDVLVRIEIGLVPIFLRLARGNAHFLVRK